MLRWLWSGRFRLRPDRFRAVANPLIPARPTAAKAHISHPVARDPRLYFDIQNIAGVDQNWDAVMPGMGQVKPGPDPPLQARPPAIRPHKGKGNSGRTRRSPPPCGSLGPAKIDNLGLNLDRAAIKRPRAAALIQCYQQKYRSDGKACPDMVGDPHVRSTKGARIDDLNGEKWAAACGAAQAGVRQRHHRAQLMARKRPIGFSNPGHFGNRH